MLLKTLFVVRTPFVNDISERNSDFDRESNIEAALRRLFIHPAVQSKGMMDTSLPVLSPVKVWPYPPPPFPANLASLLNEGALFAYKSLRTGILNL